MKGKSIESDTIKGPLVTFLNPLVNVDVTIPEAEKAQEHKTVTFAWASPPLALEGGTVPGTSLELNADFVSHSSPGLCYTLLESSRFLWSTCSVELR